jgi:hypothetical protein
MPRFERISLAVIAATMLTALPASAGVVFIDGPMHLEDPPPSNLHPGYLVSDHSISLIQEQQGVTLGDNLDVNILESGFYDSYPSLTGGVIESGTEVSSWLVHLDRDTNVSGTLKLVASVTFDTEILGLIIMGAELAASDDILGLPGTAYGSPYRGLEFISQNDWIELSEDRRTVSMKLNVLDWIDEVRIVTAVPAPGALALLGLAGIRNRRRRRA